MFKRNSQNDLSSLIHRAPETPWSQFLTSPLLHLAKLIYTSRKIHPTSPSPNPITIICISDTHNHLPPSIPPGEILIHAGDATNSGTLREYQIVIDWLNTLPHRHKVIIAGNHDICLDTSIPGSLGREAVNWGSVIYLENESIVLSCQDGEREIRVFGSPMTPRHGNWAFQYPRSVDFWAGCGMGDGDGEMDVLVTHGPPKGHLDSGFGCAFLGREIWEVRPRVHVFGHVHAGYGREWVGWDECQRAYEGVLSSSGRWRRIWGLVGLAWWKVVAWWRGIGVGRTLMVNASIVGGVRDEKRRDPIVVAI